MRERWIQNGMYIGWKCKLRTTASFLPQIEKLLPLITFLPIAQVAKIKRTKIKHTAQITIATQGSGEN